MKKFWYLPLAAAVGASGLIVWTAATAAPPTEVAPGVNVADVTSGNNTARDAIKPEDSPKPDDSPSLLPTPAPTASITAIPDPAVPQTQLVPAQLQTYAPADDKGGLRDKSLSDDGPTHDLNDDKGGLRDKSLSDGGPGHDLKDDKGGKR